MFFGLNYQANCFSGLFLQASSSLLVSALDFISPSSVSLTPLVSASSLVLNLPLSSWPDALPQSRLTAFAQEAPR